MLGNAPKNHPHQAKKRGVDDSIDDRETPPCVFVPLDAEFHFTLDAAANHHNAKCDRYCTLAGTFERQGSAVGGTTEPRQIWAGHGLQYPWGKHIVWCNPPFSGLRPWAEQAWDESDATAVLLLPNNREEQPFWQKLIEPYRDRAGSILTTRNLAKRRPFLHHGSEIGNRTSKSPPFGLVVVIWDRRRPELRAPAPNGAAP
jgi:hypothetical protein